MVFSPTNTVQFNTAYFLEMIINPSTPRSSIRRTPERDNFKSINIVLYNTENFLDMHIIHQHCAFQQNRWKEDLKWIRRVRQASVSLLHRYSCLPPKSSKKWIQVFGAQAWHGKMAPHSYLPRMKGGGWHPLGSIGQSHLQTFSQFWSIRFFTF